MSTLSNNLATSLRDHGYVLLKIILSKLATLFENKILDILYNNWCNSFMLVVNIPVIYTFYDIQSLLG